MLIDFELPAVLVLSVPHVYCLVFIVWSEFAVPTHYCQYYRCVRRQLYGLKYGTCRSHRTVLSSDIRYTTGMAGHVYTKGWVYGNNAYY